MQGEPLIVTLSYPDGGGVSFPGRGAVIYTAQTDLARSFAATGFLTLGDMTQLMNELMDTFGEEDVHLALSLALVARRMPPDEENTAVSD